MLIVVMLCAFATAFPSPDNDKGYNYPTPVIPLEDFTGYNYPKTAIPFDDSTSEITAPLAPSPTPPPPICPPGTKGLYPNCRVITPPPPKKPVVDNEYLPPSAPVPPEEETDIDSKCLLSCLG